jgi:hypothetical protein
LRARLAGQDSGADGYRLTLTIWLDQRASALFERRVADALRSLDELTDADGLAYEFHGGRISRSERGANADPAALSVIAPRTLFAVEPERLRVVLGELAAECKREADEQHERDEEIAEQWLQRVRALSERDSG